MCGINGITDFEELTIKKMSAVTAHRGPDATGFFNSVHVSLGHNRLSVIDLSENANQPMHSPDKRYTIVFNGEIYNYKELRAELASNWKFTTKSDTEVLLAGYIFWGVGVLNKLKGIFAFAIWDAQDESLLLVRDQMGVKPLYYAIKKSILYFSSELSGLIEGTGYRTLSQEALSYYITLNYIPSPHTLVEGISKLPPAHMLSYKKGNFRTERYWTPQIPQSKHVSSAELRNVIGKGVTRQLVSDRPVGVFLSGGLDSSIVLHHASESVKNLRTFSVDFEMVKGAETESGKFNSDARLAEKTASIYGAEHTTFTLSLENVRTSLNETLEAFDEPIANPTVVSQYLLSKWVREKGVVVALGGDGGDELFGGYTRHRIVLGGYYYQKFPKIIQKGIGVIYPQAKKLSLQIGTPLHMQLLALKTQKYAGLFLSKNNLYHDTASLIDSWYQNQILKGLNPIDTFMRVDRETWLADESLARTDRTSMAFGLEARVPLLDIDIVCFADSIVGHTKYRPWSNKKILRDAYKGYLPDYLFNQPKRGWVSPGAKWFRDPVIKEYVGEVLSGSYYSGLNGLYNWAAVQQQFTEHLDSKGYHLYPLWNIMALQIWAKKHNISL